MRPGFPTNVLYALLLLGIGLGGGWWLRGSPDLPPSPKTPPTEEARNHTATETGSGPQPSRQWGDAFQPAAESPSAHAQAERPETVGTTADNDKASAEEEFRALLKAQAFTAAMDLYLDVERRQGHRVAALKAVVLEHLEHYLNIGDAEALTGLVDAFLSVYYDDIDVQLILARYQVQSDYIFEAARSFQLAFAYSQARTDDQQQVEQAFQGFVEKVDRDLADQNQWRELTRFYETLGQLDVARSHDQLRLAELYLRHGDPGRGRDSLRRLTSDPTVGAQASALLEGTQQTSVSASRSVGQRPPSGTDAIALETLGSHYHLPLRLNDNLEVRLVIDTGASVTTLSREAFQTIRHRDQFTELGPQIFNTAGGVSRGTMYRVDTLRLGKQVLSDVPIAVLDFDMPDGIDGLLGMNVLRHFRFQVDQDRQELHLDLR